MFIFVNCSWPTPLNHQWCKIFSKISSTVIESERGCMLTSIHQTNQWHIVVQFFTFLVGPIFSCWDSKRLFWSAVLNILIVESFSCGLGRKTAVVFSHCSLTPIICEVITLCDLQILLMNPVALLWLLWSDGLSSLLFTPYTNIPSPPQVSLLSVTTVIN